jgi:hypothetical protein
MENATMSDTPMPPADVIPTKTRLPWFVAVSPKYYNDAADTGFGWEGWAAGGGDAIRQALEECHVVNDRDPETWDDDVDPDRAKVHVAEIDFRRFAGPLLHWAGEMGGWDTPLWRTMGAAVREAGLTAAPLTMVD